jgi:N-acetylglucosamine-6-sulfatase
MSKTTASGGRRPRRAAWGVAAAALVALLASPTASMERHLSGGSAPTAALQTRPERTISRGAGSASQHEESADQIQTVQSSATPSQPPNVLILVSDDQSWSTFNRALMPNLFSGLVDQGALFNRGYDVSSLCCPSRAEILTGLYEHHTGVDANDVNLLHPTIVDALHGLGYRTALEGKYLNSWNCNPRAEFDEWACMGSGPSGYSLVDPLLNLNGQWRLVNGYTTDILANRLVDFIAATPETQPFFALYAPTTPHLPANDNRCDSLAVAPWRPPSYQEDTTAAGKPVYMRRGPLGPSEMAGIDDVHTKMTRAVRCFDPAIRTILDGLGSRAADTLIFYISDNGYLFGEHERWGKWVPYEEAVRVPFVIRYPAWLPQSGAFTSDALVQNVDIAPTIAEAVGIPWTADGRSLAPLLQGQGGWVRTEALIESCRGVGGSACDPFLLRWGSSSPTSSTGVVTANHKYVDYRSGESELYDLDQDPNELSNRTGDPSYQAIKNDLQSRLAALLAEPPVDTTIVSGPSDLIHTRVVALDYYSQSRYATFVCRFDVNGTKGKWKACDQRPNVIGPLAAGTYKFWVAGKNENGQADLTPATRTFQIQDAGPAASVDSGPPVQTTNKTLSFTFSSPVPEVTFECQLTLLSQAGDWSPCTSPFTSASLSDGQWLFQVRAVATDGTRSDPPAQHLSRVDHVGPIMVLRRAPVAKTRLTEAHFVFMPVEAIKGSPNCRLDGGTASKCASGRFDRTGLAAGAHSLAITGADLIGIKRTTIYSWVIDLTRPVLTVTGPAVVTNSTSATISWTADETLFAPATEFVGRGCAVDDVPLFSQLCMESPSALILDDLAEGSHTYAIQVVDEGGNVSVLTEYSWTVDTIAPVATILSGPGDPTSESTATFTFSAEDATEVTFACSLDGAPEEACDSGMQYPQLAPGGHTFTVVPTDLAGNVGDPDQYVWTISG